MIEGKLGNIVICQASYNEIVNMDFNQQRQGKHGQQVMERSKILFGVSNPIDLVEVKIFPLSFKVTGQNQQINLFQFQRNYVEDLNSIHIIQVNELEKIKQKSLSVRNKNSNFDYEQENRPKIKMTDSIVNDAVDEKLNSNQGINPVYSSQTTNQTNF